MKKNSDYGYALACAVELQMTDIYGATGAFSHTHAFDADKAIQNEKLAKDLEIAEDHCRGDREMMAFVVFMQARLMALKQTPFGNREMTKCVKLYEECISLGQDEAIARYFWAVHEIAWDNHARAVELLTKALAVAKSETMRVGIMEKLSQVQGTSPAGRSGCLGVIALMLVPLLRNGQ